MILPAELNTDAMEPGGLEIEILHDTMSQENMASIQRGIEAFNDRDFDSALALLRDDITWERFLSQTEADSPAVRGKEELRAVWMSQVEAVDIRVEVEELIPVGEHKVVMPSQMVARGRNSELPLTAAVVWVCTFDADGLVKRVEVFDDREEAFKAAGLSE